MANHYALSTEQGMKIKDFVPDKVGDGGRSGVDNLNFVNGVLWILRSGARWSDLPERYDKYKSVHKRFSRGAQKGVWEKVFHALIKDRDYDSNDVQTVNALPVIPPRMNHKTQQHDDKPMYKERNLVERLFNHGVCVFMAQLNVDTT